MTVVADRIARLRALMAEKGIDAYVVRLLIFTKANM